MTEAFSPAASATAMRSSTFSLRVAAISTSSSSGPGRRRAYHLKVEVDLLQRERNVLVGLGFDLDLELLLAQAGLDNDLLGDNRTRRHGHGDMLGARGKPLPAALDSLGHGLQVVDVAVGHRVAGRGSMA